MEEFGTAVTVCAILFIALPWLVFHYVTKWKQVKTLTPEDENLLDLLYETARKLDDRMDSIERIIAADDPNWRQLDHGVTLDRADRSLDRNQPVATSYDRIRADRARVRMEK